MTKREDEPINENKDRLSDLEKLSTRELAEKIVELENRLGGKEAAGAFLRGELLQAGHHPGSMEMNLGGHDVLCTALVAELGGEEKRMEERIVISSQDKDMAGKKVRFIKRSADNGEQLDTGIIQMEMDDKKKGVQGFSPTGGHLVSSYTVEFKIEE